MRKIYKSLKVLGITGLFLVVSTVATMRPVLAAGATLTLTTSSSSVQNGSTVTVTVGGTTGSGSADAANVTLTYDASKLSFVSLSTTPPGATPTINSGANYSNSSGKIAGGAYTTIPVSGSLFLLSATFKATAGTGSTGLQLSTSGVYATELDSGGSNVGASLGSATVNFTTPTCPSGYSGTYPNCTPPAPTSTPAPSAPASGTSGGSSATGSGGSTKPPTSNSAPTSPSTTAPPVISNDNTITVGDKTVAYTNATFSVATLAPAQVYIQYGLSKSGLTNSTTPDSLGTKHDVSLDRGLLIPGQTYYYVIVTKNASGAITQSKVESFTTKGLTVSVGVFDKDHQPLKHKLITLHSNPATATTDDKGYAVFSNVIPGDHHVVYADNKKEYSQPVSVVNNIAVKDGVESAPTQNLSIVYGLSPASKVALLPLIVGVLVVGAIGAAVFMVLRKRQPLRQQLTGQSMAVTGGSGVALHIATTPQVNTPPINPTSLLTPPTISTPVAPDPVHPTQSMPPEPLIGTLQGPVGPQPGSMITPKDDADIDNPTKPSF